MLDILTIVHSFADVQTASRIRRTCRRLVVLIPQPTLYSRPDRLIVYEYRVGSILHRLDGPAREYITGDKIWCRGGIYHREYHPYYIVENYRAYRVDGVFHREVGPSIMYDNTGADWYMRGILHRKVGQADMYTGIWFTMGKKHRLDGPIYGNVYEIRGVKHSISCIVGHMWIVNGISIRI